MVRKLNNEITRTQNERELIRGEVIKTAKLKEKLEDKKHKCLMESQLFYNRAQTNIYS